MTGIDQIKKKVKNHEFAPVIALSGSERALLDEALLMIRQAYTTASSADFNHHKYVMPEDDVSNLLSTLQTMPFLGRFRLVEVHYAEKLSATLVSALLEYVLAPCASTLLVLVFSKTEKKNKLLAAIEKSGAHCSLSIDEPHDRRLFLHNEAKQRGLTISSNTADFLLAVTDGDLLAIRNALEKLALVDCEITIDAIEEQIVNSAEQDVFLLARFLSEGRLEDALVALGRLRNSDENALKFLGVLMWQFRVLVHIRSCLEQGMADWDIRKHVAVFGDRFVWMLHVAKKRSLQFHLERLSKLLDCDKALKTGATIEPYHYLEKFVYQSAVGL